MILFEYTYTPWDEIFNNFKPMLEYSPTEYAILGGTIFMVLLIILYFIPTINIYGSYLRKEKEKQERKNMIKQIAMQKDINDEIEKELNI